MYELNSFIYGTFVFMSFGMDHNLLPFLCIESE
jgi:hypothetical protein